MLRDTIGLSFYLQGWASGPTKERFLTWIYVCNSTLPNLWVDRTWTISWGTDVTCTHAPTHNTIYNRELPNRGLELVFHWITVNPYHEYCFHPVLFMKSAAERALRITNSAESAREREYATTSLQLIIVGSSWLQSPISPRGVFASMC